MKFIKYLLFAILGIGVIYLIICLLGDKSMTAKESVMIKASPEMIYEEVVDYHNWSWSPWKFHDSTIVETITGSASGVGARSSWTSENSGAGWQEIVEADASKHLKMNMNFGFDDIYSAQFFFEPMGDSTKVTWVFDEAETPFLFRGFMTISNMNVVMGNMYKEGLKMLKDKAESKKPKAPTMSFEMVDVFETWYVGKTYSQVKGSDIDSAMFATAFAELMVAIGGAQNMTGSPISIAHHFNQETNVMDLEIALPVATKMVVKEGLQCSSIPGGKCAKYVFMGPYEGTAAAWGGFMQAVGALHKPRWSPYEIYVNDPADVKDPSEIITWLMQPVE